MIHQFVRGIGFYGNYIWHVMHDDQKRASGGIEFQTHVVVDLQ